MWAVAVFFAIVAVAAVFGVAMVGSRERRIALLVVATPALALPYVISDAPLLGRAFWGLALAVAYMRLIELALERRAVTPIRRAMHAAAVVEMRFTRRVPPRFDRGAAARLLVTGALTALALLAMAMVPNTDRTMRFVRGFATLVFMYVSFDAGVALGRIGWAAAGFELPRVHDDPIKSRTVAEFWGERWNRIVGGWLRVHCFMPLARRRRPYLGLAAAFAASTVLHIYLAGILSARAAVMWAIFFSVQIPIVFVERALRVSSWPHAAARAWTIGILCAVSPFFVDPVIRTFDAVR